MSRGQRPTLLYATFLVLAFVILSIAIIHQLERARPAADFRPIPEAAIDEPDGEVITCRRRSPNEAKDVGVVRPAAPEIGARVTSTQVVECPERFDGRVVTFVGEVIGDVLQREDGAWVLMNDDPYALDVGPLPASGDLAGANTGLSVWLDDDLQDLDLQPGGPDWRGTVLRIRGTVVREDPADGGGLTIRAQEAEVVAEAQRLPRTLHASQAVAAAVFAAAAAGVVIWERATRRRR